MSEAGTNPPPNKLQVPLAPLLPRLELEAPLAATLHGAGDVVAALDALLAASAFPEAIRLVAHALPKREAVWWCCMCARAVPDPVLPEADAQALTAAEAWVRRPEDANRRAAMDLAQKTAFRTPEAWSAVGAFWSGGSMAPAGQPEVPPAPHLTGVAVAGGVTLAAVRSEPQKAPERYARFILAARDIAAGGAGRMAPEGG